MFTFEPAVDDAWKMWIAKI